MNLVLTYCWKEWRAQRGMLLAYFGLVVACLTLGFSLVPTHLWTDEGFGAHALSWFVVAGVIGVVAFVTPNLVRSEFGAKDDQFVRRLPGALAPSFAGKLLFFGLALLALPLLGLAAGELVLTALGHDWDKLFVWDWRGEVNLEWSAVIVIAGGALLLAPWVWAIGTWLPGGRMALGGTLLFVLLVGVGVFAVLRQSPNIEKGLAWWHWLWAVPPTGLAIAGLSWIRGRRGGGALRSARVGLCAAAVAFTPPGAWLGVRAWHYHHPDLQQLGEIHVVGISPDGRFALAYGNEQPDWCGVPIRIDLDHGSATQLGSIHCYWSPSLLRPHRLAMSGQQRLWAFDDADGPRELLDLQTGAREPLAFDTKANRPLPTAEQHRRIVAELQATTSLRLPGNRPVWCDDGAVWTTNDDGTARRVFEVDKNVAVSPAGHAVNLHLQGGTRIVDPATGTTLLEDATHSLLVRDVVLFVPRGMSIGQYYELRHGQKAECTALRGCTMLGLVDDDHVLAARVHKTARGRMAPTRLFLFRPADSTEIDLALPAEVHFASLQAIAPLHRWGSLLARDPAGRIWLHGAGTGKSRDINNVLLWLNPATKQVGTRPRFSDHGYQWNLLDWPDANSAVLLDGARIVRIDLTTNATTLLFPRPQ
ncbi:MAG: hypothetical protein JNK15_19365 [Planctomycetes bacterium]|nr:hypothetical protein [Planctomycetota bacterium]